jgi:predicted  nucleic acid-binding Zn-ribbon protein
MEERIAPSPAPKTAAQYRMAVDNLLAELQQMNEQSEKTWVEIEQLKAESAAIRAETEKIMTRIDARLAEIEALF